MIMAEVGFIILRHVNSERTNQYWIHSYNCIRQHYPENIIMIIDDNSNYTFITDIPLYKTYILNSEYPGRGELLPYFYYLHIKLFDIAVIIHDSVFINKYIDMKVDSYKIIWDFEHDWDQLEDEKKMIDIFDDLELTKFYENKQLWKGCFGGMCVIKHDYLTYVNSKHDISKLLNYVTNRYCRSSFERIIGCLLNQPLKTETLLGDIMKYCPWGILFEYKNEYSQLPIIKVWSGR